MLWWGYRFWFLLIFWILHVHEIGAFMPNLSVFIFLMLPALYRMICKNSKSLLCKNSLNVPNVKPFSNFFFQHFWLFNAFLVRMTTCILHIRWFPWHQEPKWPQWPQRPQQPQWPLQPHFIKKPLFLSKNVYFWWFVTFYCLKKSPSVILNQFTLPF